MAHHRVAAFCDTVHSEYRVLLVFPQIQIMWQFLSLSSIVINIDLHEKQIILVVEDLGGLVPLVGVGHLEGRQVVSILAIVFLLRFAVFFHFR